MNQGDTLYPGDTWTLRFVWPDAAQPSVPRKLPDGMVITGLLYWSASLQPAPLFSTLRNPPYADFVITVSKFVTDQIPPDDLLDHDGSTRLRLIATAADGTAETIGVVPLQIGDIRRRDQSVRSNLLVERARGTEPSRDEDVMEWDDHAKCYFIKTQEDATMNRDLTLAPVRGVPYADPFQPCGPLAPPSPPVAIVADFTFLQGDDWPVVIPYTDSSGTNPINLSGYQPVGELYFDQQSTPVALLTLANGGLQAFDPTNGIMTFKVGRGISGNAPIDLYLGAPPRTRLLVTIYDTLGNKRTIGVKTIRVVDPRTATEASFPVTQTSGIAATGSQGPSGPAVSVNGHTGPNQNLTAADVGALTAAQVGAMLAQAQQAAFINSLIFG